MSYPEALGVAEQAVAGRCTPGWCPTADHGESGDQPGAAERVAFAEAVRAEVRPAQAVRPAVHLRRHADPAAGRAGRPRARRPAAAARLRERYRVVLVDEFQDTDPVQWEILRRAFHGHSTLILIGDPKQAIYAFRGADVYSYLDAVGQADQVADPGHQLAQRPAPCSTAWTR